MRLTRSKKIATSAVCAAIAIICVVLARFVPVGWIALYAISGAVTLMSVRLCGYAYGLMTYLVTGLVSLSVFPYCWPYVMLFGLHAVVREVVFGKPPVRKLRRVLGLAGLCVYFYGVSLALIVLMSEVLGLATVLAAIGGPFVLVAIVTVLLVVYDFGVDYLATALGRAVFRSKRTSAGGAEKSAMPDPFATGEDESKDQPSGPPHDGE